MQLFDYREYFSAFFFMLSGLSIPIRGPRCSALLVSMRLLLKLSNHRQMVVLNEESHTITLFKPIFSLNNIFFSSQGNVSLEYVIRIIHCFENRKTNVAKSNVTRT